MKFALTILILVIITTSDLKGVGSNPGVKYLMPATLKTR